jgi:hypothetical protein
MGGCLETEDSGVLGQWVAPHLALVKYIAAWHPVRVTGQARLGLGQGRDSLDRIQ